METKKAMAGHPREFGYDRVCKGILQMIREENLKPGDRLPTERELSLRFSLNHQTVRKGLAKLVEENVINRRVGAGTFLVSIPGASDESFVSIRTVTGEQGRKSTKAGVRTYVGVLMLARTNNFLIQMMEHLHEQAQKRNLELQIRTVSDFGPRASEVLRQMADQGCTSIVLPSLPSPVPILELMRLVRESPVPIVLSHPYPGLEGNCYEKPSDFGKADFLAVAMACRYFKALGFGHIAFLGPDEPNCEALSIRVLAYNRFMSRQGLGTYVGFANPDAEDLDRVVRGWAPMAGDLAGLCYDDDMAVRLITSLHKQDLRIPDDVAVLGFNNIPLGLATDPPLSSIQFAYDYVAGSMLDHAQAMIRGESAQSTGEPREVLVIRESCGGRARCGERLSEIIEQSQSYWKSASTDAM